MNAARASFQSDHSTSRYEITLDHKIHFFQGKLGTKGLPIYNFHNILTESIATTVAENMTRYPQIHLVKVNKPALFEKRLAYPSPKALAEYLAMFSATVEAIGSVRILWKL